jgi:hypothetical protein
MEEITIVAGFWKALKPNQVSYGFIVLYPSSCGGDVAQILKNAKIPWCGFFFIPQEHLAYCHVLSFSWVENQIVLGNPNLEKYRCKKEPKLVKVVSTCVNHHPI